MSEHGTSTTLTEITRAFSRMLPVGIIVATVFAHILIAARSVGPIYLTDEVGYLAGAELLGRGDTAWALCGSSYSVGLSVPLAALWWLPLSPVMIYQVAVMANALLGAAVMWPATVLGRSLGASRNLSLVIAALVTLVPTRALTSNYVIAENLLTFALVWGVVFALRLERANTLKSHAVFGATVGAAVMIHSRAIPLATVAVLWLLVRAWQRRSTWNHALCAIAPLVSFSVAGYLAQNAVGATLFAQDDRVGDLLLGRDWADVLPALVGQAFTQVAAWSLLSLLGYLAIGARLRQSFKRDRAGAWSSAWAWWAIATGVEFLFIVFVIVGNADFEFRIDMPLYSRYMDAFIVPVAVLAGTMLWRRSNERLVRIALLGSALAIGLYAAVLWPTITADSAWIPLATPGLVPYLDPYAGDRSDAMLVAMASALAMSCLLYFLRRQPRLTLSLAVVAALLASVVSDALRLGPFEGNVRAQSIISSTLEGTNADAHNTSFSYTGLGCAERNKLQFELASIARIAGPEDQIGPVIAVGPAEWALLDGTDFERVLFTVWEGSAIWWRDTSDTWITK